MVSRSPHAAPVQKFQPSNGMVIGLLGLAAIALSLGLSVASSPDLEGARVALGLAVAGVLVWAALIRPRATAYSDVLVLHHMLSDTHVPLAAVDDVAVRHTLNVWVGGKRHVCSGIGRSTRSLRAQRRRTPAGARGAAPEAPRVAGDYPAFVETRIRDLAAAARRDARGEPPPVRRVWARRELAALTVLVLALVVTLLV